MQQLWGFYCIETSHAQDGFAGGCKSVKMFILSFLQALDFCTFGYLREWPPPSRLLEYTRCSHRDCNPRGCQEPLHREKKMCMWAVRSKEKKTPTSTEDLQKREKKKGKARSPEPPIVGSNLAASRKICRKSNSLPFLWVEKGRQWQE